MLIMKQRFIVVTLHVFLMRSVIRWYNPLYHFGVDASIYDRLYRRLSHHSSGTSAHGASASSSATVRNGHSHNNDNHDKLKMTIMCVSIRGGTSVEMEHDDDDGSDENEDDKDSDNTTNSTTSSSDGASRRNRRRLKKPASLTSLSTPSFNSKQIGEKLSLWKNETTEKAEKAKRLFLDKITLASTVLLKSERDAMVQVQTNTNSNTDMNTNTTVGKEDFLKNVNGQSSGINEEGAYGDENGDLNDDLNDEEITFQSDLLRPGRSFHIVTTAAIPWFTGTAVNPLLRAAYLCRLVKEINNEGEGASSGTRTSAGNSTTAIANKDENEVIESSTGIHRVTLVIPWLELEEDRLELYGEKHNFTTPQEQETYIRQWLRNEAQMSNEADEQTGLQIIFYPARYHTGLKSIFAMGDIVSLILDDDPNANVDVCILEEPEHLNFYRAPGEGWTKKFNYVIGIIHTNYVEYASAHYSGLWTAPAIRAMSSAMVRAYCHVVIKLSNTLQTFAEEKERTSNVHGVRSEFLEEGLKRATENKTVEDDNLDQPPLSEESSADAYFIGKLLWAKGLDGILEMQNYYKRYTGRYFPIDIYGNGPQEKAIKRAFHGRSQLKHFQKDGESDDNDHNSDNVQSNERIDSYNETTSDEEMFEYARNGKQRSNIISNRVAKLSKQIQATTRTIKSTTESLDLELPKSLHEYRRTPIPAKFPGRVDHATLKQYKVFVNPSLSEVLCTTTAEALAMGKFVIIPVHPSNNFFMQFPNTLAYQNKLEFAANLSWALSHEPEPLTTEQQQLFTWEAATYRLIEASAITRREAKERQKLGTSRLDERIAWFHNEMGIGNKGDILRKVLGAGPAAEQVKYSKRQSPDGVDESTGGLSMKFVGSSLADAMRKTFSNGILAPEGTL